MRILNLGSLNFDKVYDVTHFADAGETILCKDYMEFLGGKGLNQSLALAKAGAQVYHAGAIGPDGSPLAECLKEAGVNVDLLQRDDIMVSGHAIIQNAGGQNCIIVCGGANRRISCEYISKVLSFFGEGDILLIQNEISNVPFAMRQAKRRGLSIAFNASPITPELRDYPLELVDFFLVNEVEGKLLAETESEQYERILDLLAQRFPRAAIILTVGEHGVLYKDRHQSAFHRAYPVPVVDTAAAGDTFCGYFLAGLARDASISEALEQASLASALVVGRKGTANSIPTLEETIRFGEELRERLGSMQVRAV